MQPPKSQVPGADTSMPSSFEVVLPGSADVTRLRRRLAKRCGLIASGGQAAPRLVCRGRVLRDGVRLSDAGLCDGDRIYVVPAACRGVEVPKPAPKAAGADLSEEALWQILSVQNGGSGGDPAAVFTKLVRSNPKLRAVFEKNRLLNQLLDRPQELQLVFEGLRSNGMRQEVVRNTDLEMRRLESLPHGYEVLRAHYEEQNRLLRDLTETIGIADAYLASSSSSSSAEVQRSQQNLHTPPTKEAMPDAWSSRPGSRRRAGRGGDKPGSINVSEDALHREEEKLLSGTVLPWEALFDAASLALLRQNESTQLLMEAMARSAGINLQAQEEELAWPPLELAVFPTPAIMTFADATDEFPENAAAEAAVSAGPRIKAVSLRELNGTDAGGIEGTVDHWNDPEDRWRIVMDDGSGKLPKTAILEAHESLPDSEDVPTMVAANVEVCQAACLEGGFAGFVISRGVARFFSEAQCEAWVAARPDSGSGARLHFAVPSKGTAPAPEGASRWRNELGDLERAGFLDRPANLRALEVCRGNVDRAVNHLLM